MNFQETSQQMVGYENLISLYSIFFIPPRGFVYSNVCSGLSVAKGF